MRTILTIKTSQDEANESVATLTKQFPRFKFDSQASGREGAFDVAVVDAKSDQSTIDGMREVAREVKRPMSKTAQAFQGKQNGGQKASTPGNAVADAPVQASDGQD